MIYLSFFLSFSSFCHLSFAIWGLVKVLLGGTDLCGDLHDFIPKIYESILTRTVVTLFGNLIHSSVVRQGTFLGGIM